MTTQRPGTDSGILIVDDHRATVDLLLYLLNRAFPERAMRSAGSAEEALDLCRTTLPRLVIMDIGLPGASGIEAARQIKALSPAVAVVMHSSHDHAVYREQCATLGAEAFVSKSRTHADLIPAIARLLPQSPTAAA